jgi:hypothetical protein
MRHRLYNSRKLAVRPPRRYRNHRTTTTPADFSTISNVMAQGGDKKGKTGSKKGQQLGSLKKKKRMLNKDWDSDKKCRPAAPVAEKLGVKGKHRKKMQARINRTVEDMMASRSAHYDGHKLKIVKIPDNYIDIVKGGGDRHGSKVAQKNKHMQAMKRKSKGSSSAQKASNAAAHGK